MPRATRRSGMSLVLIGLGGVAFSWATDPRWGFAGHGASADIVDAINQGSPGTYVGIAGGIVIAFIGMWLLTRRTA